MIWEQEKEVTLLSRAMFFTPMVCETLLKCLIWHVSFKTHNIEQMLERLSRERHRRRHIFFWLLGATIFLELFHVYYCIAYMKQWFSMYPDVSHMLSMGFSNTKGEGVLAFTVYMMAVLFMEIFIPTVIVLGYSFVAVEEFNWLCKEMSKLSHAGKMSESETLHPLKEKFYAISDAISTIDETYRYYILAYSVTAGTYFVQEKNFRQGL